MAIKKGTWGVFLALALLLTLIFTTAPTASAMTSTKPLSPALYILAEDSNMAMSALKGNSIDFSEKDFCRAMNLSKVTKLTITQAPPMTDGELRVGNILVSSGQTLGQSDISKLTYHPAGATINTSSFKFTVNDSAVDMTCKLYHLDEYNQSPTLYSTERNFTDVSTHKNVILYGTLPCYDPDGDETVVEIVSYPQNGSLILTNKYSGEYTYIPTGGYSGKDEFRYVARDKYGNYSAAATVTLTVSKPSTSVTYADMTQSRGYNAALTMTEKGIMLGTQIGTTYYFEPNKTVSREDFVVMAMKAVGITEPTKAERTIFADDSRISDSAKSLINVAYELGYVKGEDINGSLCFSPDRAITKAEAACILARMLDASTPTVTPIFSDSDDIPAWAATSIYSLNYMGILCATNGDISPVSQLTRADTAVILAAVINSKR